MAAGQNLSVPHQQDNPSPKCCEKGCPFPPAGPDGRYCRQHKFFDTAEENEIEKTIEEVFALEVAGKNSENHARANGVTLSQREVMASCRTKQDDSESSGELSIVWKPGMVSIEEFLEVKKFDKTLRGIKGRREYERCLERRICVDCHKSGGLRDGYAYCESCIRRYSRISLQLYYNRRRLGLCTVCGKVPSEKGRLRCADCRERAIAKLREKARKRMVSTLSNSGVAPSSTLYGTKQVAKIVGVDYQTIRAWIAEKKIRPTVKIIGGKGRIMWRFTEADLRKVKAHVQRNALRTFASQFVIQRHEKGICIRCGKRPAIDGETTCALCARHTEQRRKRIAKQRRRQRLREGLCLQCGRLTDRPGMTCTACLLKRRRIARLAYRLRRVSAAEGGGVEATQMKRYLVQLDCRDLGIRVRSLQTAANSDAAFGRAMEKFLDEHPKAIGLAFGGDAVLASRTNRRPGTFRVRKMRVAALLNRYRCDSIEEVRRRILATPRSN